MYITIIGTGYVGLVTGTCLAEMGNQVCCIDVNETKIRNLKQGIIPIYEPGLEELVKTNIADGRLNFVTSLAGQPTPATIYFIAVGTPSDIDGSADLKHVLGVAHDIGKYIKDYALIVNKSTVPIGTGTMVKQAIAAELKNRGVQVPFDVASNPEFLKEGTAVKDFMRPDRIVLGVESEKTKALLKELYFPFTRNHDCILFMNLRDAEMTKYASNAMLATKISFINEIASLCEYLHVDVENVRLGIGADPRIGYHFIYPGCGYGGSCFPKDVKALIHIAEQAGFDPLILKAVENRNAEQKLLLIKKLTTHFGENLSQLNIALWGLSFKPQTDDMREASSCIFLREVISHGAKVKAYDPAAMPVAKQVFPHAWFESGQLTFVNKQEEVFPEADVFVLLTEWNHFRNPDFKMIKQQMRGNLILDGRNQYHPTVLKELGFEYQGIGRR